MGHISTTMHVCSAAPVLVASLLLAAPAAAHGPRRAFAYTSPPGVASHDYEYTFEGTTYEGFVAYPSSSPQSLRPGLFIGHTWMGLGKMEKYRCEQAAALGYVCFAPDLYGKGIRPKTDEDARKEMDKAEQNITQFYAKLDLGLSILRHRTPAKVNSTAIFANGYCFGGQMVLELARRGVEGLIAVSSFHGELGNLTSQDNDRFGRIGVAVHHADGDYQGAAGLLAIEDELRAHNASYWATHKYGNCIHGWTDPTSAAYRPFEAAQATRIMFGLYAAYLHPDEGVTHHSGSFAKDMSEAGDLKLHWSSISVQ